MRVSPGDRLRWSGCEPKQTPVDAMEPPPETGFPATLCRWVGEIVQSSPEGTRLTLLELIIGALLASGGHVTQAFLALTPRLGWQAYHWMLEHGRFRLLGLIGALCRIVRREIGAGRCFVVIDDTLAPRCSVDAPGAAVRFDHAANARRSCCASASSRCPLSSRAGIARCRWSAACAAAWATPASSLWPCCARSVTQSACCSTLGNPDREFSRYLGQKSGHSGGVAERSLTRSGR